MFEDALMDSGGRIKTKAKNWSIATLTLNWLVLATLILWPLLHPEALPSRAIATLLVEPPPPQPRAPTPAVLVHSVTLNNDPLVRSRIPKGANVVNEPSAPSTWNKIGVTEIPGRRNGDWMGNIFSSPGNGPVVTQAPVLKLNVSSGVMAGNLIQQTVPQYPPVAKVARIAGTVVLEATISRAGTIASLRVVSGPPMLQRAALDAVRTWRYTPYQLNGQPVDVETTVNVVFSLGE